MTSKQLRVTSDLFDTPFFKSALGFEQMVRDLTTSKAFQTCTGYPPCNITRRSGDETTLYEITMAVAGFTQEDLEITVEQGVLTVSGQSGVLAADEDVEFLHKGIAERNFIRKWKLVDNLEVVGADLENGILRIQLETFIPEEQRARVIQIGGSTAKKLASK